MRTLILLFIAACGARAAPPPGKVFELTGPDGSIASSDGRFTSTSGGVSVTANMTSAQRDRLRTMTSSFDLALPGLFADIEAGVASQIANLGPSCSVTFVRERPGLAPLTRVAVDGGMALISVRGAPRHDAVVVPPATLAQLRALARDPSLFAMHGSAGGSDITDTLSISDGLPPIEISFHEPVPDQAKPLIALLDDLAAHPSTPPSFDITLTVGTGPLHFSPTDGTLTSIDIAEISALLANPELAQAKSIEPTAGQTRVTLHATGDVAIDLHYPAGQGPAVAMQFEAYLEQTRRIRYRPTAKAGEGCGGNLGIECGPGLDCDYRRMCETADAGGTCVPEVASCPSVDAPVCACGGKTYANDCERLAADAWFDHDGSC